MSSLSTYTRRFFFVFAILSALTSQGRGDEHSVQLRFSGDTLNRTVVSFHMEEFERRSVTIDDETFHTIFLDHAGCAINDRAGNPQLPALRRSLVIPDAARMEIRVLGGEYHDVENIRIAPWKGAIVRGTDPSTIPYTFGEVYSRDAWYPRRTASLRDPYILHDVRGAVLEIFPFQYNPVRKVLRVFTSMELEVVNAGQGEVNTRNFGPKPDRSFYTLYERHFANYSALAGSRDGRIEPPPEDGDMLVICHGSFMEAIQPLVDWKNAIGIYTTLVDVATIGNDAYAIQTYINGIYYSGNLSYVLFVGDYDHITSPHYYGGVDGISDPTYSLVTPDFYPDIFVGRFSAETVAHVETQVQRTIEYEQEGHDLDMGEWNTWGMGIADDDGPFPEHYHEDDSDHMEKIENELLAYGFTKVDPFYPKPSMYQVIKALNEGRRVVNYCGHGGNQGWSSSGLSVVEVDELTNVGRLPFINSVACNGGDFTDTEPCFAEVWLHATHNGQPAGAIACYMCSTGMYGPDPMFAQGNHAYNNLYGGADRFWMEINWSLGGCWFGGSCLMMDLCGNWGVDMFMTWHIFGDPSLRLTGTPVDPTLLANGGEIPVDTPVTINLTVDAGPDFAHDNYFILGGVSGTYPGTPLQGGLSLPLNFDPFTYLIFSNPNNPVFQNFYGTLDASGQAQAAFSTVGVTPINAHFVGTKLFFSGVVWPAGKPYELATNVKVLYIVE